MFMKPEFKNMLDRAEKFYIYGFGVYAKKFFELCEKYNYTSKIEAFVISLIDEYTEYKGVPIIGVSDIKDVNTQIFIASSQSVLYDIKRNLIQIGANNVVYVWDYIGVAGSEQSVDVFDSVSFEGFCRNIAKWFVAVEDKYDCFEDIVRKIYNMGLKRREAIGGKIKRLTYITYNVDSRDYKIFTALKEKGYKTDIIWLSQSEDSTSVNEIVNAGISVRRCLYEEEALYYALKSDSSLFILDEVQGYAKNYVIKHILAHKEYFGKIVFFPYDVCIGSYSNYPHECYISERYAMENSDGVILRYFDNFEYLKSKFNVDFKGKTMFFFDYCEKVSRNENNSFDRKEDDKLKIAYVASHLNMSLEREISNKEYSHEASIEDLLKVIGSCEDCVLDFFCFTANEMELRLLEELKSRYNNFNFHIGKKHKDLMRELQNFDYLTEMYENRKMPKWPFGIEGYSENSYINSMTNKYFDAISAGIPIIASVPVKMVEYLEKLGVAVNMTLNEFDIEYLKANKEKLKKNVLKVREELKINKHIYKFCDLLEKI